MRDFHLRNQHPEFDSLVEEALGHYVYVLCDGPVPFYVGKGGGKDGTGNARLLEHFEEARAVDPADIKRSRKVRRIHEIWERGDVHWYVLRSRITDQSTAFEIEAAAIDLLVGSGFELTNEQGGHRSKLAGRIATPSDVFANAAKPCQTDALSAALRGRPILLFNIRNAVMTNGGDHEAATREAWKVGKKFLDLTAVLPAAKKPIAIGIVDGIARSAMIVDAWESLSPEASRKDQRWRMVSSQELDDDARQQLVLRNFRSVLEGAGFWQRGGWIAFEIAQDSGSLTYMRGVKQTPSSGSIGPDC